MCPMLLNDVVILIATAAAATTTDLKQIDKEMQAILAELLMPAPQPAVQPQPQLAQMTFQMPAENAVMSDLVDHSQPQILPLQLMQTPGALLISITKCSI